MAEIYDIVVVGGGVAGLIAAGTAAGQGSRVLLIEKMEKPARKLRITGKGRCNLTNLRAREGFLEKVRSGAEFVSYAYDRFDNRALTEFFESIGIPLTLERGERIFPESGRAWDVAEGLVRWVKAKGGEIRCDSPVTELIIENNAIKGVKTDNGKILASQVIMSTGGVSYPSTGSTGEGHQMAYDAGHGIEPLRPALVPLVAKSNIKGLSLRNVEVSLIIDREPVDKRFGEMEFNDRGITGPIILQISRTAVDAIGDNKQVEISIDLKPALDKQKLMSRIDRDVETLKDVSVKILLQKLTPSPLHSEIARQSGINSSTPLSRLDATDKESLAYTLKNLKFSITGYRPFTEAIITAGGVELSQVDPHTMESLIVKGLFFAGELLDIDADTGGFNIQLACSTGRLAGESAAAGARNRKR